MPSKYVEPDLAIAAEGPHGWVKVWHTYAHHRYDERNMYWFAANPHENVDEEFDIRMWPGYDNVNAALTNVVNAVLRGDITPEGASWRS